MASLMKRGSTYYAQFYDSARTPKRKRLSLSTKKKSVARRLLVQLEDAYALDTFDPWTDDLSTFFDRDREIVTVQEALSRFLDAKRSKGRSENTINSYRWIVGQWIDRVGSKQVLAGVRPDHIEPYVRDASVAQSTRLARFRHVRSFFNWCTEEGYIDAAPTESVERPRTPQKLPKHVTRGELQKICRAVQKGYQKSLKEGHCREGEIVWHVTLFRFAFFTGLRVSELARLRWRDLDLERGLIYIREQKNRKEQTVPLTQKAREVVNELDGAPRDHYVFSSPEGPKTDRSAKAWCENVSKTFSRFRDKAGIDRPITFHGLRHGFCTALAEAGKSAATIQAAARHADVSTSMKYVHLSNQHLKTEMDGVF
jgi:integrase